jgi:hypothetical protein
MDKSETKTNSNVPKEVSFLNFVSKFGFRNSIFGRPALKKRNQEPKPMNPCSWSKVMFIVLGVLVWTGCSMTQSSSKTTISSPHEVSQQALQPPATTEGSLWSAKR